MLLGFFEVIGSQIEFTNVFIRTLMTRIQFQCLMVIEKGLFQQIQFSVTVSHQIIDIRIICGAFGGLL